MSKKAVTIVGFGPSALTDPEIIHHGHLWTMNNAIDSPFGFKIEKMPVPIHSMFEIHNWDLAEMNTTRDGPYLEYYQRLCSEYGTRVVLAKKDPRIPCSYAYPRDQVKKRWPFHWRYIHSTGAYMIVLAILEGYELIRVLGIDMEDYCHKPQRAAYMFWLGVAEGLGIHVDGDNPSMQNKFTYGFGATLADLREWIQFENWAHINIPERHKVKAMKRAYDVSVGPTAIKQPSPAP